MSPSTCLGCGCARPRPAAIVNEEIRQLVAAPGTLDAERYGRLLAEWAEASRGEAA